MYSIRRARIGWRVPMLTCAADRPQGTIESGKLADLVVLRDDPFASPEEHWLDIKVEWTMLGGRWVYES
jgi:predicted amidohydrolase YtcJ